MTLQQAVVGLVIVILFLYSMFMPRYALDASKQSKAYANVAKDNIQQYMDVIGSDSQEDAQSRIDRDTESVKEGMEKLISQLKKYNVPYKFSSFYIATHSVEGIVKQTAKKVSGENEFFQAMSDAAVEEVLQQDEMVAFIKGYNWYRVYIWSLFLLVIIVLLSIIMEYREKFRIHWSKMLAVLLGIVNFGYVIVVHFVVAQKLTDNSEGIRKYVSSSLTDSSRLSIIRKVLWCLHGSGFAFSIVLSVLLILWVIWCYLSDKNLGLQSGLIFGKRITGMQPEQIINWGELQELDAIAGNTGGEQEIQSVNSIGEFEQLQKIERNLQIQTPISVAGIVGKRGSLQGAEIDLDAGEQIAIGRDPNICQLILSNPKVSRKHCTVAYNISKDAYLVSCYSANGVQVSGHSINTKIMASQKLFVPHGTKLMMADGKEIILLR